MHKLSGIIALVAALVLSGCGGGDSTTESPTAARTTAAPAARATAAPAAQATTAPAAQPTGAPAALPTPSFESVSDLEPTVGAVQASGTLAWRDQVLRNDAVVVSVKGLAAPQNGQVYAAWLSGQQSSLPLGKLTVNGETATLNYVSPTQQNLLGAFERVYVTEVPEAEATTAVKNVILSGALPAQALGPIRQALVASEASPSKTGFALGLRQETDELLRHAQFLKDAFDANNFALVKVHAEHTVNIIAGSQGADFGDRNGDGRTQNPGDGFGLESNGTQAGYIKALSDQAQAAAAAPDATDSIKVHAGHVRIAAENTLARAQDVHARANKILQAGDIAATQQDVLNILALSQQIIQGVDTNLNEQIEPIPGEGGVLTAYQHAQLMAGVALAPGAAEAPAPAQVQAAPAPQAEAYTVDVGDNFFTANKITVPVGATVVWTHKGQKPHTVTADNGGFDSGEMGAGATFKFTFEQAGTFPYFCQYHGNKGGEGMAGTVIVTDQSAAAQPPAAAAPPPAAQAPAPAPATQAPAPAPAPAGAAEVVIGDNTFTPQEISVPVGGKVIWKDNGQKPHTVTADNGAFNSGTLKTGATFEQTFTTPGTYQYFCEFHGQAGGQGMAGVIKVGNGAASSNNPGAAAPPPAAAPAPAAVTVSMKDFEFASRQITIKAGTTVTWTNDGAKPHSATAVDGSFDTAIFQPGQSKSVKFDTPGTFAYYCELHGTPDGKEGMVGSIVVEQ